MTAVPDRPDAIGAMLGRVPVANDAKAELLRLMKGADRHYHDLRHLAKLWQRHCALCPGTGIDAPAVEARLAAAILWHDAIYVPGRRDNEQQSAALWRSAAVGGGFDATAVEWVAATILATADHVSGRPPAAEGLDHQAMQWMLDLDLSPLGDPPREFARNTARIAKEYAFAGKDGWAERRIGFLRRLAGCPRIYRSPAISAVYEAQARANISRELSDA
jgi:predicted metal-dependent HD superfamily phosphohydrolase